MFVCAATECFPDLPPQDVIQQLIDLEYTGVELAIHEQNGWMKPTEVLANPEKSYHLCRSTHRMDVGALSLEIEADGDAYYEIFTECSKLAKAMKVATLVVPSCELGTPFNEEIERLREMVRIASLEGAVVCLRTQLGRMTQDPDTAIVLCDNVKGLKLTLDPSHYIAGPHHATYEKVLPYVQHVHLRDSTREKLQVRVGQGEVDYGRLIQQLTQHQYDRALTVHMPPMEGYDHQGEMRKMRLLLDSLL